MIEIVLDVVDGDVSAFADAVEVNVVGEVNGHPRVRVVAIDAPTLWSMVATYCGGDEDQASELMNDAS